MRTPRCMRGLARVSVRALHSMPQLWCDAVSTEGRLGSHAIPIFYIWEEPLRLEDFCGIPGQSECGMKSW
jgi:hypothetical protein